MKKTNLVIDTGLKEFDINGRHTLRFNPSDPGVYNRFTEVSEDIEKIENEMITELSAFQTEADNVNEASAGKTVLAIMKKADKAVKEKLRYVFGEQNDFDEILDGVSLMAVTTNGERVITNLLTALTPVIAEGLEAYADDKASAALERANLNRQQRRALGKAKNS